MKTLARVLLVGAALLSVAPRIQAQLAPGPLSSAHAHLDGPLKCLECHGRGDDSLQAGCLACHEEISWLLGRRRGLHETSRATPCAKCHAEHVGAGAPLVVFEEGAPERFDHARARWPLTGKHAPLKCEACHKPGFRVSKAGSLSKRKDPARGFIGLESDCAACHKDVHAGRLDRDCRRCHGTEGWRPAPGFDHAKTGYPLTGGHVRVDCSKCHRASDTPAVFGPLRHEECSACHQDPHAGRLGAGCARCHTTGGFRRVDPQAFDHGRTRYPLAGRHASVGCAKCHDPKSARGAKPPFGTCDACHRDPHAGQALLGGKKADCAACHTVDGFRPSTYTVERHAESAYRLVGKHASVKCADCHASRGAPVIAARNERVAFDLRPRHDRCAACHEDAHAGQLAGRRDGGECAACHVPDGWTPSTFAAKDHAALRVSLEGRHDVPCAKCHRPRGDATSKFDARRGAACVACHENPHGEQFAARTGSGSCGRCHDAVTFKTASRFNHDRDSRFPLLRAHGRLLCDQCHDRTIAMGDRRLVVYSPVTLSCKGCHATVCAKATASGDAASPTFCTVRSAPSR